MVSNSCSTCSPILVCPCSLGCLPITVPVWEEGILAMPVSSAKAFFQTQRRQGKVQNHIVFPVMPHSAAASKTPGMFKQATISICVSDRTPGESHPSVWSHLMPMTTWWLLGLGARSELLDSAPASGATELFHRKALFKASSGGTSPQRWDQIVPCMHQRLLIHPQ